MEEYYKTRLPSDFMETKKRGERYKAMEAIYPTLSPEKIDNLLKGVGRTIQDKPFYGNYGIAQQMYKDSLKYADIAEFGGIAKMAGGGIAAIRRPNAIPPESGPTPQGLPSMYNRVKKI